MEAITTTAITAAVSALMGALVAALVSRAGKAAAGVIAEQGPSHLGARAHKQDISVGDSFGGDLFGSEDAHVAQGFEHAFEVWDVAVYNHIKRAG